jgi:hypothetical protein
MIRLGALLLVALAPNLGHAQSSSSDAMEKCVDLLEDEATTAEATRRDRLLGMASLYRKALQGLNGPYGSGITQVIGELEMPENVEACLTGLTPRP